MTLTGSSFSMDYQMMRRELAAKELPVSFDSSISICIKMDDPYVIIETKKNYISQGSSCQNISSPTKSVSLRVSFDFSHKAPEKISGR